MAEPGVSMKDYVDTRCAAILELLKTIDEKNDKHAGIVDEKNEKAVQLARDGDTKATSIAMAAATEKGVQHNGLIEMMRGMMGRFITRETIVAFVVGLTPFAIYYFGLIGK